MQTTRTSLEDYAHSLYIYIYYVHSGTGVFWGTIYIVPSRNVVLDSEFFEYLICAVFFGRGVADDPNIHIAAVLLWSVADDFSHSFRLARTWKIESARIFARYKNSRLVVGRLSGFGLKRMMRDQLHNNDNDQ